MDVMECAELVPIFRGSTRPWSLAPAPPRPALTARPQSSLLSAGSNNTRYTTPATATPLYYPLYSPLQTHQNLLPNVISSILSEDKSGELTLDSVYGMF